MLRHGVVGHRYCQSPQARGESRAPWSVSLARADHEGSAVVQAVLRVGMRHGPLVGQGAVLGDRDGGAVGETDLTPEEERLVFRHERRASHRFVDERGNRDAAQKVDRPLAVCQAGLQPLLEQ